ncbi:hypothetical protein HAX54_001760 [Datura stramonium]|uniref:Uncharacterized protein n=1 Tax=Datura stramonium TaxID=4076 RepID=A0ABS8T3H1_DATST|nr:hypothetical protein [Datura stramonium]
MVSWYGAGGGLREENGSEWREEENPARGRKRRGIRRRFAGVAASGDEREVRRLVDIGGVLVAVGVVFPAKMAMVRRERGWCWLHAVSTLAGNYGGATGQIRRRREKGRRIVAAGGGGLLVFRRWQREERRVAVYGGSSGGW